jgi:hypothetical protein
MTGFCLWCGHCNLHGGSFDMPFSLLAKDRNTKMQYLSSEQQSEAAACKSVIVDCLL